jgi:hypothetical protein
MNDFKKNVKNIEWKGHANSLLLRQSCHGIKPAGKKYLAGNKMVRAGFLSAGIVKAV